MLKLQTPNGDDRVLLHSCCAPCSSAIIECMMANGIHPTVFYCNPNIYPQEEYETRKNEAIRFVTSKNLDFIDADYDYTHWKVQMKGLEDEPELEEPRTNQRGRATCCHPLSQHSVLGTELAEGRTAGTPEPAAQGICLL